MKYLNQLFNQPFLTLSLLSLSTLLVNAQEICNNRIDDDGDGLIDCLDQDCDEDVSCWSCTSGFYQVHSNTELVSLDPVSGSFTTIANISGASAINGAQFNHIDGHVYAPCMINGNHELGMLYSDGSVVSTGLSLPGSGIFYVGAIDANGKMYISNGGQGINTIELNSATLSAVSTGVAHPGVADFSFDITNGLFYGISGSAQLKVYNPSNGTVSSYELSGSINDDYGGYGATWSCNDGSFYAYNNNSGKIYTVNVNDMTATQVINASGNLTINDGFNCVNADPPFESNCNNGIDDDGDGLIDCDDPDCDSSNECIFEICDNGIDDDNDGWTDCSDSECYYLELCLEICDNDFDDNGNGLYDMEDPQCGGASGIDGGLESNRRLSEAIANRMYTRRAHHWAEILEKRQGLVPMDKNLKGGFETKQFIPDTEDYSFIAETSPTDLIHLTNATEVSAADFYKDALRVGTVLQILTENGVYEHSKYICDRLDGSRLLDISKLHTKYGELISYELLNDKGEVEYVSHFSSSFTANESKIESHWSLSDYASEEVYLNTQIWAVSYPELISLTEETLSLINQMYKIKNVQSSDIPMVFVTEAALKQDKIELTIRNRNRSDKAFISANYTEVEGGNIYDFNYEANLGSGKETKVLIDQTPLFDIGISLSSSSGDRDEIYLADGAWGADEAYENAEIISFETIKSEIDPSEERFSVSRNVILEAEVGDYLNVFRTLKPKGKPVNLQAFNTLSFEAKGSGYIDVIVSKASITDWDLQARKRVKISGDEPTISIHKSEFLGLNNEDWSDVNMLVFSVINDSEETQNYRLELSNVHFYSDDDYEVNDGESANHDFTIYPNPTTRLVNIKSLSNNEAMTQVVLLDAFGKVIMDQPINQNEKEVMLDLDSFSQGFYLMKIYKGTEIIFKERIIKID